MPQILKRLASYVWSHRLHLALLLIAGGLIGAALGYFFPVYKLRVYVRYNALNQEVFRQVSFKLSETAAIRTCFSEETPDNEFAKRFLATSSSGGNIYRRMVAQVYPTLRQQMLSEGPPDRRGIGLLITADGPEKALLVQQIAGMKRCLTETMMLAAIADHNQAELRRLEDAQLKAQIQLTSFREDLTTLGNRIRSLRDLAAKYPDSGKVDNRQVVEVRGEAAHFMPLQQQIIAAEAGSVDTTEKIRRTLLELEQLQVSMAYQTKAQQLAEKAVSWSKLQPSLAALRNQIFNAQRLANPMLKDALASIVNAENAKAYELSAEPTTADETKVFGRTIGGLLGLFTAILVFLAMALWHIARISLVASKDASGA